MQLQNKTYEIAQNYKEALELFNAGFGYSTKADAEKALNAPEIDYFYRSKLRIYPIQH